MAFLGTGVQGRSDNTDILLNKPGNRCLPTWEAGSPLTKDRAWQLRESEKKWKRYRMEIKSPFAIRLILAWDPSQTSLPSLRSYEVQRTAKVIVNSSLIKLLPIQTMCFHFLRWRTGKTPALTSLLWRMNEATRVKLQTGRALSDKLSLRVLTIVTSPYAQAVISTPPATDLLVSLSTHPADAI